MKIISIIVSYYTGKFLPPLLEILQQEPLIVKVFVFDNSNELGISKYVEKYSKTKLIISKTNIGFAAGVNAITTEYYADYYLLINPDTLPVWGFTEKLIDAAERYHALISGPRFFWDDKKQFRFSPAVGNSLLIRNSLNMSQQLPIDAKILANYWALLHDDFWNRMKPFSRPFLSGACLLIKNDLMFFRNKKIFDQRFFLYSEDTDLCIRAMIENKIALCVPDANVVHYWDQSPSDNKNILTQEAHKKFFNKYYPRYKLDEQKFVEQRESEIMLFEYIGEFNDSPVFKYNNNDFVQDICYFEIAGNPIFVPFAQCEIKKKTYQIPRKHWNMMKPRIYFTRIRNINNQVIKMWKWKKL